MPAHVFFLSGSASPARRANDAPTKPKAPAKPKATKAVKTTKARTMADLAEVSMELEPFGCHPTTGRDPMQAQDGADMKANSAGSRGPGISGIAWTQARAHACPPGGYDQIAISREPSY